MKRFFFYLVIALAALGCFKPAARALDTNAANALLQRGRFEQNLGSQVPLDAVFRDESGQPVALRGVLGPRPAILVLGYHECPMLCSLVLGGLVESMTDLRLNSGQDFDLIDVSINPTDTPAQAARQKRVYFKRYARHGADLGWHFLTSPDPATVRRLAEAVGFHYAYDPTTKQFAHPSGVMILTPEGKVARYFFGVNFDPAELQTALAAAGQRKVGSRIQDLLLTCFHYNPINGKYGALVITAVRVGGVLTLLAMAGGMTYLVRRVPLKSGPPSLS